MKGLFRTWLNRLGRSDVGFFVLFALLVALFVIQATTPSGRPSVAQEIAGVRMELAAIRQLLEERLR